MHLFAVNVTTIVAGLWLALATFASPPQPVAPFSLTPSPEPPTSTPLPTATAQPQPTDLPYPPPDATAPPRPTLPPPTTPSPTGAPTTPPRADDPDVGVADPALTKRASVNDARVGDMVEFTLVVTNNGAAPARDVVVTDPLPAFLDLWNATTTRGLISVSGRTVTITIGEVAPGDVITIRIMTRVNSLAQPPDNRNTALVTTTSNGDEPANNQDAVALGITVAPPPTPAATATPVSTAPASPAPSPSAAPALTAVPAASAPPATGNAAPAAPATATPPRAVLPNTGAERTPVMLPLLALLGIASIGLSLMLRRRWMR